MGRKISRSLILICLFSLAFGSLAVAASMPRLNKGEKWNIAYYEGGPFSDYAETMKVLLAGLMELGWIDPADLPRYDREIQMPYWDWLGQCQSSFLTFKGENGFSADWDDQKRALTRERVLKKLKSGSIDLIIAMGTWAGLDLANNEHSVPVLVLSTSDPIKAGIIQSVKNSGYAHVTARVDPNRYERQIRMFSRIVDFKTLGIAYEDTPEGRVYSAVDSAERIAGERGFKIVSCEVIDTNAGADESDRSCFECYEKLAETCDAVYVTALTCVDRQGKAIADIFRKAQTPSFAMVGSRFVKDGIMLSISSDSGYAALGRYNARKFGEILNGTKPGDLKQIFEDPLEIAINMETVRQIGFKMPESILKIASEIYER